MGERTPIKVTQAPLGNGIPRALIVVVVALIIIVVVFAVVPFLQNAFSPQPSVALTNLSGPTRTGCGGGASPQYYTYSWTFTLANTGNTNANVTVGIYQSGSQYTGAPPLTSQSFLVPKATSPNESMQIALKSAGCTLVSLAPQITSQKTY